MEGTGSRVPGGRGVSGPAERFLDDFERGGSTVGTWEKFVALVRQHPDSLPSLVEGGLRRQLSGAAFLGDAVSYLAESAVGPLAELAVQLHAPDKRRSPRLNVRSASEEVLAHVALQFPRLLDPWLTELFEKEVNFDTDYGDHPWRESGDGHHAYLLNVALAGGKRARRVLGCLLETRTPAAFRALERHEALLVSPIIRAFGGGADGQLPEVGYERPRARFPWVEQAAGFLGLPRPRKEGWRRLFPEASYHLRFPDGYLPLHGAGWRDHPTYHLDAEDAVPARLGGRGTAVCGVCGQRAHHLITLDPVPAGLGVTSVPALALEACFNCVWSSEELWWKHDRAGKPSPHRRQGGDPGGGAAAPLRETTVRLVPTPARWYWQDARNERENLTRLGGHPSWIQSPAYPQCPGCRQTMPFLFQLDAACPGDGGETFGDGILYTHWCDSCRVSISLPQGT
jgi:hypothetical protein